MTVKLKALGLALAAAFALSAVAASAASAQTQTIHSGSASGTTYGTGEQVGVNQLDTPAGSIKCNEFSAKGSYAGTTTTEVTVSSVTYGACTAFGLEAHIDTMGCSYRLVRNNAATIIVHIVCPTTAGGVTDEITITPTQGGAAICHIDVQEQTIETKINNQAGSPDDVSLEPSGIVSYSVERTVGGAKCPTNGAHSDGVYTGAVTVKGYEDAGHAEATGLTYN